MKQNIPYIYILLYSKLKERAVISNHVSMKFIYEVFNHYLRKVPKIMQGFILEDMESLNLVKRISKREYVILESNCVKDLNNYKKYDRWISSVEALE